MDYTVIRRVSADREERSDWDSAGRPVHVGDQWETDDNGRAWKVTRVTAGDDTRLATIVIEPDE